VNEKQNLILNFALESLAVFSLFLTIAMHFPIRNGFYFFLVLAVYRKVFVRKEFKSKKFERELTAVEVIAWFSIFISAICIFGFVITKGLLDNLAFIIPMWIIFLALGLLDFAKKLAALNSSEAASN
jgi:hypothetical protein